MAEKKKTTQDETPEVEETPVAEATPEPEAEVSEPAAEAAAEEPAAEATPGPDAEEPAAEPEEPPAEATPEPEAEAPAEADEPVAGKTAAAPESAPEPPAEQAPPKRRKRLPRALRHKHSKPARERGGARKSIARTPKPKSQPGRRQERRGVVVSDKSDKTIVVSVDTTKLHPRYKKVVRRSHKLHAHDEQNSAAVGDVVRIVETRPLSKTKHWRLAEIVEKAK